MQTRVYPFTNSMLLHCLDQMLAVMKFSQHRVSTSRTVKLCSLSCGCLMCGACQNNMSCKFFYCATLTIPCRNDRGFICKWKTKEPQTPNLKQLSGSDVDLGSPVTIGVVLVLGMKAPRSDVLSMYHCAPYVVSSSCCTNTQIG